MSEEKGKAEGEKGQREREGAQEEDRFIKGDREPLEGFKWSCDGICCRLRVLWTLCEK